MNSVHYFYDSKSQMTISARRQRDREEMRTLILGAACSIFLEKGYEQTSIRTIAEKIEYSPGTIYLYFKDRDDIFHALHEEGFRRLLATMQPLQFVSEPFERLKAMGRQYIDFGMHNKDFYELMFIMKVPVTHDHKGEKWEMGSRTLEFLKDNIGECQTKGYFKDKNVEYLSFMIWSTVHGIASLYCNEQCIAYENMEAEELVNKGFDIFYGYAGKTINFFARVLNDVY